MCLLLLGGTTEAKKLAAQLHDASLPLIYSLAGLVRQPDLDCQVVSGGFSQFGGMTAFIRVNAVAAILDMTHPFAKNISVNAKNAAKACDIPYWRYERPAWQQHSEDNWQCFDDWSSLIAALKDRQSVFISAGQLPQDVLDALRKNNAQRHLLRTAVTPTTSLPDNMQCIEAIGPFSEQEELALFKAYKIDALVSKMSGGIATEAKLMAARQLGIPVYMLNRPVLLSADKHFSDVKSCESYVLDQFRLG